MSVEQIARKLKEQSENSYLASQKLLQLEEENKQLKTIIYRLIQENSDSASSDPIDRSIYEDLIRKKVIINSDFKIEFL